jgi:hypothetical protein
MLAQLAGFCKLLAARRENFAPADGWNTWQTVAAEKTKEGRYLIAHAHEWTMGKRFPFTHWLIMGIGGSETAAP